MTADYSWGSANWFTLAGEYGYTAAEQIAAIADTGNVTALNAALSSLRRTGKISTAENGNTSTFGNFVDQISTDPLSAPADALNRQIKNAFTSVFSKPWIVAALIVAGVGLFFYYRKK